MIRIIRIEDKLSELSGLYIHELADRARQLDSVAQLVRAMHRNCKAAGSISAREPI